MTKDIGPGLTHSAQRDGDQPDLVASDDLCGMLTQSRRPMRGAYASWVSGYMDGPDQPSGKSNSGAIPSGRPIAVVGASAGMEGIKPRSTGSPWPASDPVGYWFVSIQRQTIYQRRGHGSVLACVAGRLEPPRAPASSQSQPESFASTASRSGGTAVQGWLLQDVSMSSDVILVRTRSCRPGGSVILQETEMVLAGVDRAGPMGRWSPGRRPAP